MKSPTIDRTRLIRMAGVIWLMIGLALVPVALYWYRTSPEALLLGAVIGLIFGPMLDRLTVSRMAAVNVERIRRLLPGDARLPLIEVQSRRTYPIILFMIIMGAVLRRSPIPRDFLAPGYLVMGIALILASRVYFRVRLDSPQTD